MKTQPAIRPLAAFLLLLACGPETASPPAPALAAIYPTEEGIVARALEGGELGEPRVLEAGPWTSVSSDGDRFWASRDDAELLLGGPEGTFTVACPEEQCSAYPLETGWLVTGSGSVLEGRQYYLASPDTPLTPLYAAASREYVALGQTVMLTREHASGTVRRVPLVEGAEPETILEVDPEATVSAFDGEQSGVAVVLSPSDLIWHERVGIVDFESEDPTLVEPTLLPGRTLFGHWTEAVSGGGVFLAQGTADDEADVVWLAPGSTTPTLVSTGDIEGKIFYSANFVPMTVSPSGGWVALRTRDDEDTPSQTHLVSKDGDAFGRPISLGEGSVVTGFAPDDSAVFFWRFEEEPFGFYRADLSPAGLGTPQKLLEREGTGGSPRPSEDGSAMLMNGGTLDEERLLVIDLASDPPSVREVTECAGPNMQTGLSADGAFASCSFGEDRFEDRTHFIIGVRSGVVTPLPDAEGATRFALISGLEELSSVD